MGAMTANANSLAQLASSGGFAISRTGAENYTKAIDKALVELGELRGTLNDLQQETRLGTSPDAIAMSKYNLENVTGGSGTIGIVPAIKQLITALTQARDALELATSDYEAVETDVSTRLKN
ncbi:hypothetical protein KCV87_25280 [Actinosynnema pretiosum subsp. pretiosum]|uniref:Uncharacterized protein n=1 Tax=Actinosynnema pretiosum subsp. pretiosum TaxID=103721 RepID=A0AA45R7T7_9PSEU|nr:hypothetical protein APASM_6085 [Actinosynnema pretiosum subsp. pretiosum]QUF08160.1 hypothetical protein KCV87_25280 [Actinosynnema pretiosum subsp. pretiosum]